MKSIRYEVVDEIPKISFNDRRHYLFDMLNEFFQSDASIIRINPEQNGYKNSRIAHTTFLNACKKYGFPFKVRKRDDMIYIFKEGVSKNG